jgi:2-C-methyl-D-erythritol 2,4-cyclodiphosphate synthase
MRIGHGFDVHRLVPERRLILGGVTIPYELGLLGHSDADVLIHAINDALLGSVALGDIGHHFPDTDPRFAGISSLLLLEQVVALLKASHFRAPNIDATIVAQRPKMAPYILQMRRNIAAATGLTVGDVSVKATTTEGLGFTGRGEGIAAHAVVLVNETDNPLNE